MQQIKTNIIISIEVLITFQSVTLEDKLDFSNLSFLIIKSLIYIQMIKHNVKLKSPKQDVVQTYASPKSTFYITRKLVQTNSDRSIKLLNYKKLDIQKIQNQQTYSESRAQTTVDYRSLSTIPTHTKGQLSQNIEQQSYGINTERQQSASILSSELITNRLPKTNRVVSLYQLTTLNPQPFKNELVNDVQGLSPFQYRSKTRINSMMGELIKLNQIEEEMVDNTPIQFKQGGNIRKSIFMTTNYSTYQKMSKVKIRNKQQNNQKQQIFLSKVLKNIKDYQNEKSESKQLLRKFSQIWKENFSSTQFQDQQQYRKSSQQFKLYFNQFIEKLLNKHIIYQYILETLEWIKQQNEKAKKKKNQLIHEQRKMYIKNHKLKCVQTEIYDQKFRYKQDIKSFGMIDILSEIQVDEINDISESEQEQEEPKIKQVEYFTTYLSSCQTSYHIDPIISILDNQTKNALLSVDYTDLDQLIYKNNIEESIPQIQSENSQVKRFVSALYYQYYSDILIGGYINLDQLTDLEDNNYFEQQQQLIPPNLDKKAMLLNLRRKTREAKIQGRRSHLFENQEPQQFSNIFLLSNQNSNNVVLNVPNKIIQRRMSKSMHNLNSDQIFEDVQDINKSLQMDSIIKDFNLKTIKYKQQLRLQNLQLFEQIIKKESSQTQLVQMMIEHNLFDELKEFLRSHPNFSLNQRNIAGKPYIMLAAQSGNAELVQYMMSLNVQVNNKDLDGNTALHYAVALGYYRVADILLENGANPYIKNRCNQNPWNWNQQVPKYVC
ncbi:unnamed protein product (macronuclear) [Paramecium tetraurelia]|uniref:Uncharacterized protein n=1 Tax=Paramecium tetraurelia TaxID=5888 RepID=A0BCZ2_PARTE|nr:uncharacterized protein GSPATT00004503001 [Paramecium tetraurelia]CAK56409.1 unnamed protein product [Paramecium tetraurelia]|eukprot:XP_001423807.1 hypothetical protein (macronuclear) [Paramecium tetraurelia strain d4-2]